MFCETERELMNCSYSSSTALTDSTTSARPKSSSLRTEYASSPLSTTLLPRADLPLHPQPDTLDPALLRPGRIDRKIEIPLPNEAARMEILKIHAGPIKKSGEIDYEAVVKLSEGFNGADLRNVCTEAGMFAIR